MSNETLFLLFMLLMGVAAIVAMIFDHWEDRGKHQRLMRNLPPEEGHEPPTNRA